MRTIRETILYEDRDLLVCHKPSGVPVQSAKYTAMDMESMLRNYLAEKTPGKMPYLGLVHRLDQPVEGLILFAKNPKAAAELSRQLSDHRTVKEYLAVTDRPVAVMEADLSDYLVKDARTNTSRAASGKEPGAKEARLHYAVEGQQGDRTLLRIRLDTGRHHQIRVQMSHHGMPLVGDRKYGGTADGTELALCAAHLVFRHPRDGRTMEFEIQPKGRVFSGRENAPV